ncbi:hypothetical protein DU475_20210 [Rhodopseudomonas sp. WA056]|nr:hypothetical protein [Rhodopseudomonas sp. WA056]
MDAPIGTRGHDKIMRTAPALYRAQEISNFAIDHLHLAAISETAPEPADAVQEARLVLNLFTLC